MHFQIYIPEAISHVQPAASPLEVVGLADFVGDARHLVVDGGPDNSRGTCFAWDRKGFPQIGYRPDVQAWRPAVASGTLPAARYWIGFWKDSPPKPEDLQRPYAARGPLLTLGDGQRWIVPEARELPRDAILADDGHWRFQVQRRFHDFYLAARGWLAHFGSGEKSFGYGDAMAYVVDALRISYRLTPEVVSDLGLLNSDNVAAALLSTIDGLAEAIR